MREAGCAEVTRALRCFYNSLGSGHRTRHVQQACSVFACSVYIYTAGCGVVLDRAVVFALLGCSGLCLVLVVQAVNMCNIITK